jgi:hypothetical protein
MQICFPTILGKMCQVLGLQHDIDLGCFRCEIGVFNEIFC